MPTFFLRDAELKATVPKVDLPRAISALLHLFIPFVIYNIMYKDFGRERLSKYAPEVYELSDDRKQLYMILDVYYSIRWAMGMTIMMSRVTLPLGVVVAAKHLLVDEMGYVVGSMAFAGARPGPLTTRDYLAATFMVVAGILQHGAELQRWVFKSDPKNQGRLHTTGLFGYARFINHTGHILRDLSHLCMAPNLFCASIYLMADFDLACKIMPETVQHMKAKYGEQYEKYSKQTPWLLIPGVH